MSNFLPFRSLQLFFVGYYLIILKSLFKGTGKGEWLLIVGQLPKHEKLNLYRVGSLKSEEV